MVSSRAKRSYRDQLYSSYYLLTNLHTKQTKENFKLNTPSYLLICLWRFFVLSFGKMQVYLNKIAFSDQL